jgi:UDP-N-acetylglucosamine--N-acetylmuramyl-(pentapeptide) pyrophosphoryl-undecaprenol N-acetylglucosamine transferase
VDRAGVLWIGSRGGIEEEMVRRAGVEFVGLSAGGLRGQGPIQATRNAALIARSVGQARRILGQFKPDSVLVTGGYACVSVTLAARALGVPVLVYLPDIEPGLAIRFLSRFATRIAVTSEESYKYFPREKVVVTGYPVRAAAFNGNRDEALSRLGLQPAMKTLLVFGGSRGARSINKALVSGLRDLLPECQIVHVSGRLDADWVAGAAKGLPEALRARYHHFDYVHDMPLALVTANLAVARAGAATIGEFPAAGVPAILVPYPYSGQHQKPNADYLVQNGAARLLDDADLEEHLVPTVLDLLSDEETLTSMRDAAKALARPDAAEVIAEQLWLVARKGGTTANGERP